MIGYRLILRVVLLFTMLTANAQLSLPPPQESKNYSKIGLVLEGGSALGLAHIGVIRYLEEHRIPVNYVAGTSMGGLVGGLYAVGSSPDELEQLVGNLDWNKVLTDRLDYRSLSYRRKQDKRDFPNPLTLAYDRGLSLPSGFNAGYQIGLLLDQQVLPYSQVTSFDELPIPFRCVAMDLVSRSQYVFAEGSLAKALRSTMSLPGIFSPVRDGTHIYVDGGLLNNLPVDVARAMGADLVIAVHLQVEAVPADRYLSSFGVLDQSRSVVIAANELRSMQSADVLITVDSAKFSSTDYNRVRELITLGYEAAAKKAAILDRLSVDEATWQQYLATRNAKRITQPQVPQFVAIEASSPGASKALEKAFSGYAGKPLELDSLYKDLDRTYGTGRFGSLGFRMTDRDGMSGLLIQAGARQPSSILINPLLVIDAFELASPQFGIGARITNLSNDKVGSEWRTDVIVGSQYLISTEYYRPSSISGISFLAPRISAGGVPFTAYLGSGQIADYRLHRVAAALDFGFRLGRKGEVRLGYEAGFTKFNRRVGTPVLPEATHRLGSSSVRFAFDHLDAPVIPHSGFTVNWNTSYLDAYLGSSNIPSTELEILGFKPLSNSSSLFLGASGGINFGVETPPLPLFNLGGASKLAAYGRTELLSNKYALGRVGYLHRLPTGSELLSAKTYLFGIYAAGRDFGEPRAIYPQNLTAGVLIETVVGPVLLGGSYGDRGHQRFLIQLGRIF